MRVAWKKAVLDCLFWLQCSAMGSVVLFSVNETRERGERREKGKKRKKDGSLSLSCKTAFRSHFNQDRFGK